MKPLGEGLKFDGGKPRMSLVPPCLVESVAEVLTFGAEKYEAHNWQGVPNGEERYTDALLRHLYAYLEGEDIDKESGLPHLHMVATNIGFLIHFRKERLKDVK